MTIEETTTKLEKQIEKMDMFLSIIKNGNESVSPAAIREFLNIVLSTIKSTKDDFENISDTKLKEIEDAMKYIVEQNNAVLASVKEDNSKNQKAIDDLIFKARKAIDDIQQEQKDDVKEAKDLLNEVRLDRQADKAMIMEEVKSLIPSPYQLEATKIRDELLSLKGDERLDISAIKGFEEWANKISKGKGNNKTVDYIQGGQGYVKSITAGAGITVVVGPNNDVTISASGGSGSGDVVGPSSSVDNTIARFDSTTGKVIQGSGVTIDDSDNIGAVGLTLSGATASTLAIFNGSKALISADTATYPSLAELAYVKGVTSAIQTQLDAKIPTSYLDTDVNLAANSDVKIASQKAVKAYIDASVTGLLDLKGSTDCSSNPNYPSALKGDAYYVTVAGKIGGASGKSVDIGDVYVAIADNAGGTEASVGTSWFVLEHNLSGVVISGGALGTPSSGTLTNCSGLPISGIASLGTGVATALAINVGSAGAFVTFNGALGTPSSATLTNATGLPIAGLVASTSTAIGVGSIELGHASDTTIARVSAGVISVEGVTIDTISAANTLSNKTLTAPKFANAGYIADANGNELIIFTTTASAVNEITLANGATGTNATITASGETNTGITITGKGTKGVSIGNAFGEKVVTVTDGAGAVIDCSLGNLFSWVAGADRTAGTTTNAVAGQKMFIAFNASGGARTLTLPTSTTGDFAYGSDITGLTQTASGKTDVIGCVYNTIVANRWAVVSVVKGY